jgi:uncharacterized protein (TIGR02646 family)
MIKLTDRTLSAPAQQHLTAYQAQINAQPTYADQVLAVQALWKPQNKTFDEVTQRLIEMCPGTRRCCYCEDARGEDIEHYRPKNLYPEAAFVWENYLYACSACNSNAKRDQFAVLDAAGRVQLNRRAELVAWRKEAFRAFIGWMDTYRRYEQSQNQGQLKEHLQALRQYSHLAVWLEMQRVYRERDPLYWAVQIQQQPRLAELDELFTGMPQLVNLKI